MNTRTISAIRNTFLFSTAVFTAACSASSHEMAAENAVEVSATDALESSELAPDTAGDLNKAQSSTVLKLLDDVCGDSWCEGDYDWHFPKIVCHFTPGTCTLTFRITDPNPTPPKTYWRSCKVSGLRSFEDLVDTAPNGYQSLENGFYDDVSICIDHIEKDLRAKEVFPFVHLPDHPPPAARQVAAVLDLRLLPPPGQGDLIHSLCRAIGSAVEFATSVSMSTLYFAAGVCDDGGRYRHRVRDRSREDRSSREKPPRCGPRSPRRRSRRHPRGRCAREPARSRRPRRFRPHRWIGPTRAALPSPCR